MAVSVVTISQPYYIYHNTLHRSFYCLNNSRHFAQPSLFVLYLHLHNIKQTNEWRTHKIQTAQVRRTNPHGPFKIIPAGENYRVNENSRISTYWERPPTCADWFMCGL